VKRMSSLECLDGKKPDHKSALCVVCIKRKKARSATMCWSPKCKMQCKLSCFTKEKNLSNSRTQAMVNKVVEAFPEEDKEAIICNYCKKLTVKNERMVCLIEPA
jgi:hypothetical protein